MDKNLRVWERRSCREMTQIFRGSLAREKENGFGSEKANRDHSSVRFDSGSVFLQCEGESLAHIK